MTNPRDPEGLMPDSDESGGPEQQPSAFDDAASAASGVDPLRDRTDLDQYGSDPDVRFPGDAEDPTETTADAAVEASARAAATGTQLEGG